MPSKGCLSATVSVLLCSMLQASTPQEPPNTGVEARLGGSKPTIEVIYDGQILFSGRFSLSGGSTQWNQVRLHTSMTRGTRGELTQVLALAGPKGSTLSLKGNVTGSEEAFPAETDSPAQARFKLIRNSIGLSSNSRNNAIYDRRNDWLLEGEGDGTTIIVPSKSMGKTIEFHWTVTGSEVSLTFRPRYYQKHKNIAYFKPRDYSVWKDSVAGWCSWWAYFSDVREQDVHKISSIFADKLRDFGYQYIQIDDGYQSSGGGLPVNWLTTNDHFPSGLASLSQSISKQGLKPALWANVHFGDLGYVSTHKDWFIKDADGKPHKGPWIEYGLDGSVKDAVDAVVRPTYQALHKMGWQYVKVDALRHLLYDSSYPSRDYFAKKGVVLEDAFRGYLRAIRDEVGPNTYMLACWGVLPETVGIANGCRLGGDGFGPSTLQQYTSWNNVVWRNDPDHCDIKPVDSATHQYIDGEERIRPVLVSMAGAQLLLSDKPEVYENDANLEGVKRSSPILFTVPGQMYDYDSSKTDHLKQGLRNENGGAQSGPIDADQRGEVCPWWMLDINQPYETWTVLTHMNWQKSPMEQSHIRFRDIGLPNAKFSVFEFWSKKYLGDFSDEFTARELDPKDVATYAIRKTLDHPQILSTSRHISQGAAELSSVVWDPRAQVLSGVSRVIRSDPYSIFIRLPAGYAVKSTSFDGKRAETRVEEQMAEIKIVPSKTGTVGWRIEFVRST